MLNRRDVIRILSTLPLGGFIAGGLTGNRSASAGMTESFQPPENRTAGLSGAAAPGDGVNTVAASSKTGSAARSAGESIYASVGTRPLINARGTVTIVGATRVLPEVQQAMDEAVNHYVQLDELMEGVGHRLGEITGTEWGIVTSGASSAITVGTAGCVTGGDPDRIWQLPDLTGLKDEVIIPTYSRSAYDAAAKAVGVRMIPVSTVEELEEAIGPRTAMIMVLASGRSENGPLSLREISERARPRGIPVLVDAAAEELFLPNPHIEQGADLVAYSGGKCLRGPQCAGLLIGRKDLVQASWLCSAPHHGFGRGLKVGREEIMGMLAATEMWFRRDHKQELVTWNGWLDQIEQRLAPVDGVTMTRREPRGRGNRFPGLTVEWDMEQIPLTGHEVEELLWDHNPRIAVSGAGSFLPFPPNIRPTISINPSQLDEWEVPIIAEGVYHVLSDPPPINRPSGRPNADVTGQWDLEMTFAAGSANQSFVFAQQGSDLMGTHSASFATRDLGGTLHGDQILIRSSYTGEGVRLNYEFHGTVAGDEMSGEVSMGEYGMAEWRATRRNHTPPGRRG